MSQLPGGELKELKAEKASLDAEVAQEKKKVEDATAEVNQLAAQWLNAEPAQKADYKVALEGAKETLAYARKQCEDAMDRRNRVLAQIERLQSGAWTLPVALLLLHAFPLFYSSSTPVRVP